MRENVEESAFGLYINYLVSVKRLDEFMKQKKKKSQERTYRK